MNLQQYLTLNLAADLLTTKTQLESVDTKKVDSSQARGKIVSSAVGDITFNNLGVVTIDILSNLGLNLHRQYDVTLKIFDPVHIKGQVIINRAFDSSNASIKISTIIQ